jgi:hypothetical protein
LRCGEIVARVRRAGWYAVLVLLPVLMWPSTGRAQVRVGLTAGTIAYAGASVAVAGGDTNAVLRPHGSYALGAMVSVQRSAWRTRLGIEYSTPGASATAQGVEFADHAILDLVLLEPSVARRLLETSQGGTAWLEVGASIHYWMPYDDDGRFRNGGMAALVWTQRATSRVDLAVRTHVSVSPSPFVQDNLSSELEPSTLWRMGVTLELSWRL